MKDTVITASRKRKELWWMASCMLASIIVNVYAIIRYDAGWMELISSMGYVLVFAAVLYIATGVVRVTVSLIIKAINRKQNKPKNNKQ